MREEKLWGNDDPLFPETRMELGASRQFEVAGLERKHWNTTSPIRTIFKTAFQNADLPYFNPHSFRKTLVRLGQEICGSTEHLKAWSQNLGHEDVLTTFRSYGEVSTRRQGELIKGLGTAKPSVSLPDVAEFAKAIARELRESGRSGVLVNE